MGSLYVKYILKQIQNAGITEIDGFLCCGDYAASLTNTPEPSNSGIETLKNTVADQFDIADENIVLVQGNHDPVGTV